MSTPSLLPPSSPLLSAQKASKLLADRWFTNNAVFGQRSSDESGVLSVFPGARCIMVAYFVHFYILNNRSFGYSELVHGASGPKATYFKVPATCWNTLSHHEYALRVAPFVFPTFITLDTCIKHHTGCSMDAQSIGEYFYGSFWSVNLFVILRVEVPQHQV